jgi:hypothetical protein
MNTMTRHLVVALALAWPAAPTFADSVDVNCHAPGNVKFKNTANKRYQDMLASDKAGRAKEAYDKALGVDAHCISQNEQEINRIEAARVGVIRKSSLKLGEQAEKKGELIQAFKYYEYFHGVAADRVQMKIATRKPGDFKSVQAGVFYLRSEQKLLSEAIARNEKTGDAPWGISQGSVDAMDPNRVARLKAIGVHLGKLKAIATKQGEKFLADEDKIFRARKTSLMAKGDTFAELNKARDWLRLFALEGRVNERAVKRGDTLMADDSRKSLELAISYYQFPYDDSRDKRVQKVRDKARRLGDAHLKKGEKKLAADYYSLAGLGEKASKLEEANEAEKEKAETKRQSKFKKDQKSLEKELGF